MRREIERKFLLSGESWRAHVIETRHQRDGLVASTPAGKVRVRIEGARAWITVKGERANRGRDEYEYEIPLQDAEDMMARVCGANVVEKTRHIVRHEGLVWEIDVYAGLLDGIAYAEVELDHADQPVPLPPWVGREVTDDPNHSKRQLLSQRLGHAKHDG